MASDEELDIANSTKGAWLVKLPKHLGDAWSKAGPGQDLGFITHNKGTGEISLSLSGVASVPKVFNLTRHDVVNEPPLLSFTETKGNNVTIEGKVECRGELAPVNGLSDEYRQHVKIRSIKSNTKLRQSRTTEVQYVKPISRAREMKDIFQTQKKVKGHDKDKRYREARDVVLDRIFAAFGQKPYWDLTGLTNHTDQPQAYLKEILAEVCVKHTSGPHRLMYELKDQYK